MGDLNIGNNGENLNKFKDLKDAELKKEEVAGKDAFNIFDFGGVFGDKKLSQAEMNNIFQMLQDADKNKDGKVSLQELRQSERFKEIKKSNPHITAQKMLDFAGEVLGKLNVKLEKQQAEEKAAADKKLADTKGSAEVQARGLENENGEFVGVPDATEDENAAVKEKYDALKAVLAKEAPTQEELDVAMKDVKEAKGVITERKAAEAAAKQKEKAQAELREQNITGRDEKSTRGRIAYDLRSGVALSAWRGSKVAELTNANPKLNLDDYANAEQLLNAILKERGLTDVVKGEGLKQLLADFTHNNPSVFNADGKIHKQADINKLELPAKEVLVKYADKGLTKQVRQAGGAGGSGGAKVEKLTAEQTTAVGNFYGDGKDFKFDSKKQEDIDAINKEVIKQLGIADNVAAKLGDIPETATVGTTAIPGYSLVKYSDGSFHIKDKNGKEVTLDQLRNVLKAWIDQKKDEDAIETYKNKDNDSFDATKNADGSYKDTKYADLRIDIKADIKEGKIRGYSYSEDDGVKDANGKPIAMDAAIDKVIADLKVKVGNADKQAKVNAQKGKKAAAAKAYTTASGNTKAKVDAAMTAGVPGYHKEGDKYIRESDNQEQKLAEMNNLIKSFVELQQKADLVAKYNTSTYDLKPDGEGKYKAETLNAIKQDITDGKVPGYEKTQVDNTETTDDLDDKKDAYVKKGTIKPLTDAELVKIIQNLIDKKDQYAGYETPTT